MTSKYPKQSTIRKIRKSSENTMKNIFFLLIIIVFGHLTYGFQRLSLKMTVKSGESCLIVQNKGGGHGSIGYHLSKVILKQSPNAKVYILQDEASSSKEPFKSYPELKSLGVSIIETKIPSSDANFVLPAQLQNQKIDYIVDNWSKSPETSSYVCTLAKSLQSKHLVFISSAGMYQSSGIQPIVESDAVKSSNGARKVELNIEKSDIPFTFLRPQYLYGTKASKRYLDYFIGRAARNLPIPIPYSGDQLVCLTNLEDISEAISLAVGNSVAANEIFNVGSDRYITYKGLCATIFSALGKDSSEMKILNYDPSLFENWDGSLDVSEFAFRPQTFITSVEKLKQKLNWSPKQSIVDDIKTEVKEYVNSDRMKEVWGFPQLKYDLEATASKDPNSIFNYDFFKTAANGVTSVASFKESLQLIDNIANKKISA